MMNNALKMRCDSVTGCSAGEPAWHGYVALGNVATAREENKQRENNREHHIGTCRREASAGNRRGEQERASNARPIQSELLCECSESSGMSQRLYSIMEHH